MNFDFDPFQRKIVNGPEAGANVTVDGFTVGVIGGGTATEGLYNAGTGIAIEGSTISADLDAGAGISIGGSTIAANVAAVGFGMELEGGTASYARYRAIETVSGSSVTLQAGHAYKVYATSSAITLNTEEVPANQYGQEGHLEVFVSGTGYVVTGSNVVLANALEPDAVNNCTVRFHDGMAIISVEDHVAGYIVVSASGTSSGSLYYGLATATNEYISIDASLNGQTLDLSGATTYAGEKHVVGTGYTQTIVSGGIVCTNKTTFSNLSMDGVVVSSGTMTLGDVFIGSGSTVSIGNGGLLIEKVSGEEGTIDLGGQGVVFSSGYGNGAKINGVTVSGGETALRFLVGVGASECVISGCTLTKNIESGGLVSAAGGAIQAMYTGTKVKVVDTVISGNTGTYANAASISHKAVLSFSGGCDISDNCYLMTGGLIDIYGSNHFGGKISTNSNSVEINSNTKVTIHSGAIVDLTGNTNTTPIAPAAGITFAPGGAMIFYGDSSGHVLSSATISDVELGANVALGNNANIVTTLSGDVYVNAGANMSPTFTNICFYKPDNYTFAFLTKNATYRLNDCTIDGNILLASYSSYPNWATVELSNTVDFKSHSFRSGNASYGILHVMENTSMTTEKTSGNLVETIGTLIFDSGVKLGGVAVPQGTFHSASISYNGNLSLNGAGSITGYSVLKNTITGLGSLSIASGAIVDLTGNTNATPINPGGGITVLDGGCQVITSAGTTVSLAAGTYTQINNDGTTE